ARNPCIAMSIDGLIGELRCDTRKLLRLNSARCRL
ncbi:MAG: hypothetical protein ACI8XX_001911, partial [Polaribacter sp.]